MRQGPLSAVALGSSLLTPFQDCAAICFRVSGQPSVSLVVRYDEFKGLGGVEHMVGKIRLQL
jgi:hypothetical protein